MTELTSRVDVASGGVLTDEVGVITGDLELHSSCAADGRLTVRIRYAGALDWYTVRGAGVRLHDPRDHDAVHAMLAGVLDRPDA